MKSGRILIVTISILIGIVLYMNKCRDSNPSKSANQKGPSTATMQVSGYVVKSTSISEVVNVTGSLLSNKEVEIKNEIAGKLVKVYFKEGGQVKKGELLAKIYDDDLQAQLRKLKLEAQMLKATETRMHDLLTINGVSQQEYDEALNASQRLEADIDLLEVQIARTEIRAPFSGQAGLESVNEGSLLTLNTKLVSIQEINPMKLEFAIPERYKSFVRINQEVTFTIESDPTEYTAKIYALEPKISADTRSLLLRASTPNENGSLMPGSFARIRVPLAAIDTALMIPTHALIPELKGYKLFMSKDGKAKPVKVNLGMRNDSTVQVISGVSVGDTILTNGIMQLRPDMSVKVEVK